MITEGIYQTPVENYHDEHYLKMPVQPIKLMQEVLTPEEFKGFLKGNVIKYGLRAGRKEGESLEKDLVKHDRYAYWLCEFEREGKITL